MDTMAVDNAPPPVPSRSSGNYLMGQRGVQRYNTRRIGSIVSETNRVRRLVAAAIKRLKPNATGRKRTVTKFSRGRRSRKYSRPRRSTYYRRRSTFGMSRYRRRLYGYGAYGTKKKKSKKSKGGGWLPGLLSTIGGTIGTSVAPGAGTAIGGALGYGAGALIRQLTGFGDYAAGTTGAVVPESNDPPVVSNVVEGKGVVLKHREYIQDIVSGAAGTFNLQNFFINPGQDGTFPWLAGIAANFEHYKLEGCIFEYRPMSGNALNSTNTALGQVVMACNYNAAAPNFGSKFEMENYEFGISSAPSCAMMLPIECDKSQTVLNDLYVRPGAVPPGQDQRLYDLGNFQIATNGLQGANVNVGELWVTYQVRLFKPKLVGGAIGDTVQTAHWYGTGPTAALPLGASGQVKGSLAGVVTLNSGGFSTFAFPPGQFVGTYYVIVGWHGSSSASTVPPITVTNGTLLNNFVGLTTASLNNSGSTTSTLIWVACVQITAMNCTINFQGTTGVFPGSPSCDLIVTQCPNGAV